MANTVYVKDPRSGYDEEDVAIELKRFAQFFPNKRLLAIQLDGFSHGIIYDDIPKQPKAHRLEVSFCMGDAEALDYCRGSEEVALQKAGRAFLRAIGLGVHACFQGNPKEIIYVMPEDR